MVNLWEFYDVLKRYKSSSNINLKAVIEQEFVVYKDHGIHRIR
jgi:hypothetical protein